MATLVSLDISSESGELSRNQEDLLKLIGYLHLEHGSPEKAVSVFDALLALQPGDLQLRFSLALSLLRVGDGVTALQVVDAMPTPLSVAEISAGTPPLFHLLRSQALVQLGRLPEAARSMRMFIRQRRLAQAAEA